MLSVIVGMKHPEVSKKVIIFVKDHGQGIPEDEIYKLFEPFAKTSVETTAGEKSIGLVWQLLKK